MAVATPWSSLPRGLGDQVRPYLVDVVDEVILTEPRPRGATHPEVVAAVHRILTEMGIEKDPEPAALAGREEALR